MNIVFDKIYVIQSLDPSKKNGLTGELLFNEILQHFKAKYSNKDAELITVDTPIELINALEKIKIECFTKNIKPILHFEIHGLKNKTGLCLNRGNMNWAELYKNLIEINHASKWHLFITMAVCYGNYAMFLIKPNNPAPFTGILGSFDSIFEDDLYIKYNAFYQELLMSLDFQKALAQLRASNPTLPTAYQYINSEQTFKNICQKYFDTEFSDEKIKLRYKSELKEQKIKIADKQLEHNFGIKFKVLLLKTQEEYFERDKNTFFMLDEFPEHRNIYCVDWKPNFRKHGLT